MARRAAPARKSARAGRALPLLRVVVLVGAAAALGLTAWLRPIDGDEGYYAAAAALTAGGSHPYADYFYPQAPLLPYVYAPVVKLAGPSLRALRLLSAGFALATVAAWAWALARRWPDRPGLALVALLPLAFSPDVLSWAVTVKTYALTGLLSSLALVTAARGLEPGARRAWLPAAGLALGLAASTRLFFAPLGPVLAAGLVLWTGAGGRRQAVGAGALVLAGWAAGCAPLAAAWLRDPAVFVFDNLGYHEVRFSALRDLHPDPTPLVRLGAALAGTGRILATNPFLLGVTALAVAGVAALRGLTPAQRRLPAVSGLLAAVFFVACMAPDPVHAQYFTAPLVPLLMPLAAVGLQRLTAAATGRLASAAAVTMVAAAAVLGLLRPGMDPDPVWSFDSYERVTADIRQRSGPGDVVLSFWPGYVFGAGRVHFPGMENQFAIGVSERLDPARKARYLIADRQRLMDAFRARTPRLVVLGTWMNEVNTALDDQQMLELLAVFQAGYDIVGMHGPVKICAPRPGP